jgi:YD repeat-containing protein
MDFTHPTNEVNLEYQNGNKYSIDKEGNLIYRKFENGDQEWYEGAKLIRKKYANGREKSYCSAGTVTYQQTEQKLEIWYDEGRMETRRRYPNGHEEWYDEFHRVIRSVSKGLTKEYTYDADGCRTTVNLKYKQVSPKVLF